MVFKYTNILYVILFNLPYIYAYIACINGMVI